MQTKVKTQLVESFKLLSLIKVSFFLLILFGIPDTSYAQDICSCTENLYVNDIANGGQIHKYTISGDASLSEINPTGPWYPNGAVSEMPLPHGLGLDLNGYLYIGDHFNNDPNIRRLDCDGNIIPATEFIINHSNGLFNVSSFEGIIYATGGGNNIYAYNPCDGELIGTICLNDNWYDWGFDIYPDGTFYSSDSNGNGGIYVYKPTIADFIAGTCYDPTIPSSGTTVAIGDQTVPELPTQGVTGDDEGNIYVVMGNRDVNGTDSYIIKYNSSGTVVAIGDIDNDGNDNEGWNQMAGIHYSYTCDCLYTSTLNFNEDCVFAWNTDLSQIGPVVTPDGVLPENGEPFGRAKAINISTECCPLPPVADVQTNICADIGDSFNLIDALPCEFICAGTWEVLSSDAGTFNACDNTFSVEAEAGACFRYSYAPSAGNANQMCEAFDFEVCFEISCTPPCSLTAAGEANLACDDNDTGSDSTDDFLTIDLNPVGTDIGSNYSVSVSSGTIAPATAAYGSATSFTITDDLTAASDIVVTITDEDDANCQFTLTITDPAPCSTPDPCSITAAGEANLACDDNDTGSDGTDDFLTIDLNPTGSMLGTNYSVAVSSGTIAPATAAYGAATSFTITDDLSAAADIVITITDDVTGTCQFLLTITDPAPCSTPDPCSITAAGEANLACDDNDTGSDDTDDFLTIDLNPTGSMLGTNYSVAVSSGTIAPATAAYGAATSFTITDDLSAAADIVITITDDVTGACQFVLTITDPSPCSTPQPCSITAAGEANLACDDNDTGSDDTDDFLTIDLNPTGSMLGANYSVAVSSGTIAPATAAYGAATSFTITDDLSAAADIVITITDDVTGTCQFLLTITDPAPCSTPQPCSITAAGEANLACDDNDTGSDDTDDFLTIDLNPTGSMLGTNYSVAVSSGTIAPATAAYGAATSFTITDDLSAAADIVITITDDVTGACQFVLTITDPSPCSSENECNDPDLELCAGSDESYTLMVETGVTNIQWFLNGDPIDPSEGGNDASLIASSPGSYHYTGDGIDGCSGELCCPIVLVEVQCCEATQCLDGSITKN